MTGLRAGEEWNRRPQELAEVYDGRTCLILNLISKKSFCELRRAAWGWPSHMHAAQKWPAHIPSFPAGWASGLVRAALSLERGGGLSGTKSPKAKQRLSQQGLKEEVRAGQGRGK